MTHYFCCMDQRDRLQNDTLLPFLIRQVGQWHITPLLNSTDKLGNGHYSTFYSNRQVGLWHITQLSTQTGKLDYGTLLPFLISSFLCVCFLLSYWCAIVALLSQHFHSCCKAPWHAFILSSCSHFIMLSFSQSRCTYMHWYHATVLEILFREKLK